MKESTKTGLFTIGAGVLIFGLGALADAGIITLEIGIPLNAIGVLTILGGIGIVGVKVALP